MREIQVEMIYLAILSNQESNQMHFNWFNTKQLFRCKYFLGPFHHFSHDFSAHLFAVLCSWSESNIEYIFRRVWDYLVMETHKPRMLSTSCIEVTSTIVIQLNFHLNFCFPHAIFFCFSSTFRFQHYTHSNIHTHTVFSVSSFIVWLSLCAMENAGGDSLAIFG